MRPTIRVHYESEEELEHHGVKGMKWGQHIFGRDRSKSIAKRKAAKADKKSMAQKLSEKSEKAKAEAVVKRRERILSNPTKLYKHRKEFTQDEINTAMKNFEWERKLKDISDKNLQSASNAVANFSKMTTNGVIIWNNVAKTVNSFSKGQTDLPFIFTPQADQKKSGDKGKK